MKLLLVTTTAKLCRS